ncbi:MAG: TMEM175 family protein [Ferruginibacter sp.]
MEHPADKHPKQDFMIERIAFFSDAVFAIAITLLVIEIHPPKVIKGDTGHAVWEKFREVLPELFGLLVSFWLIAGAWMRHHQLYKYIDNYDRRFVVINLWLLFTIILFPFSTSFLFNTIFDGAVTRLQVFIYLGVPLLSNIILWRMFKLVNRKHLSAPADVHFRKAIFAQGCMIVSFVLSLTAIMILPFQYHPFGYTFMGVGPLLIFINRKKFKQ